MSMEFIEQKIMTSVKSGVVYKLIFEPPIRDTRMEIEQYWNTELVGVRNYVVFYANKGYKLQGGEGLTESEMQYLKSSMK